MYPKFKCVTKKKSQNQTLPKIKCVKKTNVSQNQKVSNIKFIQNQMCPSISFHIYIYFKLNQI